MRNYGKVTKMVVVALVCDRCGRRAGNEGAEEIFERQEFLSYHDTAGYASVFGDMNKVDLDLCQHCVKEVLGEWVRVTECDW